MVEVVTLGCRINSYESEVLKEKFKNVDNLINRLRRPDCAVQIRRHA
mgnify:CR=1 FL=1